jgi:hypothetical protein
LIEGPLIGPSWLGSVVFKLRAFGHEVFAGETVFRQPCYYYENGMLPDDVDVAAVNFVHLFSRAHPLVMHHLLMKAKTIAGTQVTVYYGDRIEHGFPTGVISKPPELDNEDCLRFVVSLVGDLVALSVGPDLCSRREELASGEEPERTFTYPAYDAALTYMQRHLDEIEVLGFDTAHLKEQMRDARTFGGCEDVPNPDR